MPIDYKQNSNRYYDLSTGAYRLFWGEHFHLFFWAENEKREEGIARTNEMFLADGQLTSKSEVIDAGCGIGSLSILIANSYGCKVTGVNINTHQLGIARRRATQSNLPIDFIEKDIMELKFENKFDTAFLLDVELHLPDKKKAIRNIKNALRKGGRIVMTAWLQNANPTFAQRELLIKPYCRVAASPYLETFDGYMKIFNKEKLKIVKAQDITDEIRRSVDDFYRNVFDIVKSCNSLSQTLKLVRDANILKVLSIADKRKAVEDVFLGPIYAKVCMDAGVFRVGYFVVER
jgi:tocopherol O-methyltransferase